jgi:hypothetical protein
MQGKPRVDNVNANGETEEYAKLEQQHSDPRERNARLCLFPIVEFLRTKAELRILLAAGFAAEQAILRLDHAFSADGFSALATAGDRLNSGMIEASREKSL